jgi:VanZ family protein
VLSLTGHFGLWAPPIAAMAGIFVVSGMPEPPPLPGGLPFSVGHFVAYAGLAMLLLRALAGGRLGGLSPARYRRAWLLSTAYGLTDEWHQRFVPGRTASVEDCVVDALGAAAGLLAVWLLATLVDRARRRS